MKLQSFYLKQYIKLFLIFTIIVLIILTSNKFIQLKGSDGDLLQDYNNKKFYLLAIEHLPKALQASLIISFLIFLTYDKYREDKKIKLSGCKSILKSSPFVIYAFSIMFIFSFLFDISFSKEAKKSIIKLVKTKELCADSIPLFYTDRNHNKSCIYITSKISSGNKVILKNIFIETLEKGIVIYYRIKNAFFYKNDWHLSGIRSYRINKIKKEIKVGSEFIKSKSAFLSPFKPQRLTPHKF